MNVYPESDETPLQTMLHCQCLSSPSESRVCTSVRTDLEAISSGEFLQKIEIESAEDEPKCNSARTVNPDPAARAHSFATAGPERTG
jgi:hypothetical protein